MTIGKGLAFAVALVTAAAVSPAMALTSQECGAKYQAAKTAGTLNGMKWSDFRKAQCGAETAAAPTPAAAEKPAAEKKAAPDKPEKKAASAGNAKFPAAIDPKYAKETAAKSRMHTCVDQYNANKTGDGNGGLRWIQKGGGYYSECNKRLKGA